MNGLPKMPSLGTVAAVAAVMALSAPLGAQETGMVSGRVVDADDGRPMVGVLIRIAGRPVAATDGVGFFVVADVPIGAQRLELSHLGYGDHAEEILVERDTELSLTVRLSVEAIELEPFVVEAWSEAEERRRTSGNSFNEIARPEIEAAARAGLGLTELLQTSMPGTLASATGGSRTCVMYRAIRSGGGSACREVTVMLDGVQVSNPSYIYQMLPLNDIERIEMLSPGQAGIRYGTSSGQAVLLIETKRGETRRRVDASRFVTGLAWTDESEPYSWAEVLGTTFAVNALTVAAALALADRCLYSPEVGDLALRTRCNGFNTASIGLLSVAAPAIGGSFVARHGGTTERTQGRLAPTALGAAMVLTGGYLLVIQGGDTAQAAGYVVLAAGVPVTLTLADRIFRVLR